MLYMKASLLEHILLSLLGIDLINLTCEMMLEIFNKQFP